MLICSYRLWLTMKESNHLEIKNLSFSRDERLLFDNLGFEFERGKITAILGPSGIGKTTLLKLIGGQLEVDSGEIVMSRKTINTYPSVNILSDVLHTMAGDMWVDFFENQLYNKS